MYSPKVAKRVAAAEEPSSLHSTPPPILYPMARCTAALSNRKLQPLCAGDTSSHHPPQLCLEQQKGGGALSQEALGRCILTILDYQRLMDLCDAPLTALKS